MRFKLASRINRPSRRPIALRPIQPTSAQAESLATLYRHVLEPWVGARDRIVAAYERTLTEMQLDSADDIRGAIDEVADLIERIVLSLTPDLRDWALRVERVHRGKWIRSILSAADVDLTTVLTVGDVQETLSQVIEWNVSLVRDVSDETRRRISNAVFSGLQARKPAREVAKDIREAIGMSRRRSLLIARDQTVKLGERLNRARQEQAGLTHFKWRHSGKADPRSWHKARNGNVYPWEEPGIPKDDMPGVPPYCGCTAQGVIIFEDE